jgi:hypothetical protein
MVMLLSISLRWIGGKWQKEGGDIGREKIIIITKFTFIKRRRFRG